MNLGIWGTLKQKHVDVITYSSSVHFTIPHSLLCIPLYCHHVHKLYYSWNCSILRCLQSTTPSWALQRFFNKSTGIIQTTLYHALAVRPILVRQ